nr:DUF11 domain-containing protein [Bacillus weihaiensis]
MESPPPILTLEKTDDPDPVIIVGPQQLTYTITLTNEGPSPATGVVINDILPPGTVLGPTFTLNVGSLPPDCILVGAPVGGIITCNIGTLLPNETRIITFNGTVDSLLTGTLTNTVIASSSELNPLVEIEQTQVIVPI